MIAFNIVLTMDEEPTLALFTYSYSPEEPVFPFVKYITDPTYYRLSPFPTKTATKAFPWVITKLTAL